LNRIAILIANSLSPQQTQKSIGQPSVKRTVQQVADLLSRLPDSYAFKTIPLIDSKPDVVRRTVDREAQKCARSRSLLLLYYFGHGVRLRDDDGEDYLAFLHPTSSGSAYLPLSSLLYTVKAHSPKKVLCILDCCYAGLAAKKFELPHDIDFCLMACTTASTRARWEDGIDHPIGVFTRALLDGLPRAAESSTSDLITMESLFKFAEKETQRYTSGIQKPYMIGKVNEAISAYSAKPVIILGVSEAPEPSAYSKLFAIATVIGRRRFGDLRDLYRAVTYRHNQAFLTPYRRPDGSIVKRPANWTVLRRYVSFLRSIGIIVQDELMLSAKGVKLIEEPSKTYNVRLLAAIDHYLETADVSRKEMRDAMLAILSRRSLPTRTNVLTDLSLAKGYSLNLGNLGLILDLLGYIRAIGMPRRRDQVYFPWAEK